MGRSILPTPKARLMGLEKRMRSSLLRRLEECETLKRALQTMAKLCISQWMRAANFP